MLGRPSSNDQAVAGVIGFILVFAGIVTYAAYVAHNEVPKRGAASEQAYDDGMADALTRLDRAAAAGLGTDASATITVPPPPGSPSVNVPLIDRASGAPPSASLTFLPDCGGVDAYHSDGAITIGDLVGGAKGCFELREQGTYASSFSYRMEYGGLLHAERDRAFVVAGPSLDLHLAGGHLVAAITLIGIDGAADSVGVGGTGVTVDLVPGASQTESGQDLNAAAASWTFTTPSPMDATAWKEWFDGKMAGAGLDTSLNSATILPGNKVQVTLGGTDGTAGVRDIALSLSYGRYTATMR